MIGISEQQLAAWISPILWPFLRILALFTAAPVLSSRSVPVRVRIASAFLIAMAWQATLPAHPVIGVTDPDALRVAMLQVLVGLAIGFAIRVVFSALELAGEVVGFQMGLNFAAFFDPAMGGQASAVARLFSQLAAILFLTLNGHILVLLALHRSFSVFPLDASIVPMVQNMALPRLGAELFASAFWIALPLVGLLLFANLALGMISRVAPQMNIFAVGFPVTLVLGLVGITITLPMLEAPFQRLMEHAMAAFDAG